MKKAIAGILAITLCAALCGCDSWMDGSYYNYTPHSQDSSLVQQGALEASSFQQIRDVLVALVAEGRQEAVIRIVDIPNELINNNMRNY